MGEFENCKKKKNKKRFSNLKCKNADGYIQLINY